MTTVLDASAVLAYLQGDKGADVVEKHLDSGATCGAANWSEVAQKVRAAGRDWDLVRALLDSYGVEVEAVTRGDAEWAAARWKAKEGLSLTDRLCLALGHRLDTVVLTADAKWGHNSQVHQIR